MQCPQRRHENAVGQNFGGECFPVIPDLKSRPKSRSATRPQALFADRKVSVAKRRAPALPCVDAGL